MNKPIEQNANSSSVKPDNSNATLGSGAPASAKPDAKPMTHDSANPATSKDAIKDPSKSGPDKDAKSAPIQK